MEKSKQKLQKNIQFTRLWSSKTPKQYKRNIINGDLHRAKQIATDFEKEIVEIKKKFLAANFPSRFINSVCNDFLSK